MIYKRKSRIGSLRQLKNTLKTALEFEGDTKSKWINLKILEVITSENNSLLSVSDLSSSFLNTKESNSIAKERIEIHVEMLHPRWQRCFPLGSSAHTWIILYFSLSSSLLLHPRASFRLHQNVSLAYTGSKIPVSTEALHPDFTWAEVLEA